MRGFTRQISPLAKVYPGFDPITGYYKPASGWSGYGAGSGFSGYSGLGVATMNASIRVVGSENGAEAFLRIRVLFSASPTPAYVHVEPFYKSGICNFSIQPAGSGDTVSAVASSCSDLNDVNYDLVNVEGLSWNTEVIPSGQNKRYFVTGPVTWLKITGTGVAYVLGA